MSDIIKTLEEKIAILEFKLELVLKLTKNDLNLTLKECKNMTELAFVMNFSKNEYQSIIELVSSQNSFYQSYKQKTSYLSARQLPKIDPELDVFTVLSKEEYENAVWEAAPKLQGNIEVCEKIAKLNGIQELYYDQLATEIKKEKFQRLDKEAKLVSSFKEHKDIVNNLYSGIATLKQELLANIEKVKPIVEFFHKNELLKISLFYNGELWDLKNDDKRVVISENSFIHNVCVIEKNEILNEYNEILNDKNHEVNNLLNFLLSDQTAANKKIAELEALYKAMEQINKNENIHIKSLESILEALKTNIVMIDEVIAFYEEYSKNL